MAACATISEKEETDLKLAVSRTLESIKTVPCTQERQEETARDFLALDLRGSRTHWHNAGQPFDPRTFIEGLV